MGFSQSMPWIFTKSHAPVLGVGGLDVGRVALGVADVVEGDLAGDAGVGHAGQSRKDVGGGGAAGSLDGLERGEVSVVAHDGDGGDHVVAAVVGLGVGVGIDPLLDAGVELRDYHPPDRRS